MKTLLIFLTMSSFSLLAHAMPTQPQTLRPFDTYNYDVSFGNVMVGDYDFMSYYFQFDQDTQITSIAKDSGDDFSIATNCPAILQAGKKCFVFFIYEPTMAGDSTGHATVKTTDDEFDFDLSGTGITDQN